MLMQFNFRNHKTYLNETSFDAKALALKDHPNNLMFSRIKEGYLKVSAIYGANASGKTNLIDAFEHMSYLVKNSLSFKDGSEVFSKFTYAYGNDGRRIKPMYEVFFEFEQREYQYGFVLDSSGVMEEWLYKRNYKGREKYDMVFEREGKKVYFSKSLKNMEMMAKVLKDHVLFLTVLSSFKNVDINNVMKWFDSVDVLNYGSVYFEAMIQRTIPHIDFDNEVEKKRFETYLSAFEPGLIGVRLEKTGKKVVNGEEIETFRFFSQRRNKDTKEIVERPLELESSGTLKMISLYESVRDVLKNGGTLFIDELDAKLHPLLTRKVINMFQNETQNPNNAQLIFTTHDINLLKKDFFRRDQIWFCEKDEYGITDVYSLAEYKFDDGKKVRYDASYDKDYLSGKYGAVPLVKEFGIEVEYGD